MFVSLVRANKYNGAGARIMNGKLYLMILLSIGSAMCFLGWVINIVKLTRLDWQPPYKQEIIRSIGIIPPVGAIMGWVDIE